MDNLYISVYLDSTFNMFSILYKMFINVFPYRSSMSLMWHWLTVFHSLSFTGYYYQPKNQEECLRKFSSSKRICRFYKNDHYKSKIVFWDLKPLFQKRSTNTHWHHEWHRIPRLYQGPLRKQTILQICCLICSNMGNLFHAHINSQNFCLFVYSTRKKERD